MSGHALGTVLVFKASCSTQMQYLCANCICVPEDSCSGAYASPLQAHSFVSSLKLRYRQTSGFPSIMEAALLPRGTSRLEHLYWDSITRAYALL
ncbi:hypothetical protein BDW68DRAFT_151938 [Aspergillus falconensis]